MLRPLSAVSSIGYPPTLSYRLWARGYLLLGHALSISGFFLYCLFLSPMFTVSSMDYGVFQFYDPSFSAASGIGMIQAADVLSFSLNISFPFDPGSEGIAGLGWML